MMSTVYRVSSQQAIRTKVGDLFAQVTSNGIGNDYFQRSPLVTIFLPGSKFLRHESGIGVKEGDSEVVPQRVAAEIRYVQIVPGNLPRVTLESRPWVVAAIFVRLSDAHLHKFSSCFSSNAHHHGF